MPGRFDRVFVLISGSLAACGGLARPEPPSVGAATCLVTPAPDATATDRAPADPSTDRAPIVIAVDQPIEVAHAPRPESPAEQLAFAQIYETLVRVDCTGSVAPGIAVSWRPVAGEEGWLFTLRPDARFHDGTAVTARAVAESLAATTAAATYRERDPRRAGAPMITNVTVLGEDLLRVDWVGAAPGSDAVAVFASPELTVGKVVPDGRALGSGPYEMADATAGAGTGGAGIELRPAHPRRQEQGVGQPAAPASADAALLPLAFRVTPGGDPRNALDVGVDVLVTADPAAIDYALARGAYITAPLPWDGAYVLFVPVGSDDATPPVPAPAAALEALARDAVPGVARASTLEASWTCPASRDPTARPRGRSRIVFVRGDRTATGLAERLVALAQTDRAGWIGDALPAARDATLTAAPLSEAELAASLRAGRDAAYVMRVGLSTPRPCPQSTDRVVLRAVPLVDTRRTAILRGDLEGVTVDAAGTLYFSRARRRVETEPRR